MFLVWSTRAYQPPDLALLLPWDTFTNDYHRIEGLGIMYCYNGLGTVIDCGEHPTGLPIQLMLDAVGFGLAVCFEWDMGRRVILVVHGV